MNLRERLQAADDAQKLLWLVLIWLLLGAVLWIWWDERNLPDVRGVWASSGCETMRTADGASHLKRRMRLGDADWRLTLDFYDDEECAEQAFSVDVEGPYDLGPKAMHLRGATTARFDLGKLVLTPHSEIYRSAFDEARCAGGGWKTGEGKEVTETGCLGLVPTKSTCPVEFDIVKIEDGRLFLGDRSAGLCETERYPAAFAPHALRRIEP